MKPPPARLRGLASPVSFVTGFVFHHHGPVTCPPHRHRAVEIVFHQTGRGVLHLPRAQAVPFAAGQTTLCPARQTHHQTMDTAGTDWCILLVPPTELVETLAHPLLVREPPGAVLRAEMEHLTASHSPASMVERSELDLRAATVLAGLLVRARRCADTPTEPTLAETAAEILATRCAGIDALDEVARSLDVGADHLRHVFRAHHGMPMVRFLNRLRIARAKELLAHSTLPLRDIAHQCGWRDEQYLCAVFKRLEGRPPGAFRIARADQGGRRERSAR